LGLPDAVLYGRRVSASASHTKNLTTPAGITIFSIRHPLTAAAESICRGSTTGHSHRISILSDFAELETVLNFVKEMSILKWVFASCERQLGSSNQPIPFVKTCD